MSASPGSVEIQNCLQLNVSKCKISETEDRFVVTVYNPLSHTVSHFVRLPVQPGNYTVQDNNGKLRSQREKHVYLNDCYFILWRHENSFWNTSVLVCYTLGLQNVLCSGKYPINLVITSQRWETLHILNNHLSDLHNVDIISLLIYLITLVTPHKLTSNFIQHMWCMSAMNKRQSDGNNEKYN
jgi:hypothetical protein